MDKNEKTNSLIGISGSSSLPVYLLIFFHLLYGSLINYVMGLRNLFLHISVVQLYIISQLKHFVVSRNFPKSGNASNYFRKVYLSTR